MPEFPPLQFPDALANDEAQYLTRISHDIQMLCYPPMVRVLKTGEWTIPASGGAKGIGLTWTAPDYDDFGFWSGGSPARLTVPAGCAGFYVATLVLSFAASPTTTGFTEEIGIVLVRSGIPSTIIMDNRQAPNQNDETRNFSVSTPPISLEEGDYLLAYGWQRSVADLLTDQSQMAHSFSLHRVGATTGSVAALPGTFNALVGIAANLLDGTALNALQGG